MLAWFMDKVSGTPSSPAISKPACLVAMIGSFATGSAAEPRNVTGIRLIDTNSNIDMLV
ncbi:hypothetical protein [Luteimonas salinilitoris]|uniref:hypothetical protein n=1 Tax=Luteimonas salinilitoris TaxID=3237697 RepID=UPI00351C816D